METILLLIHLAIAAALVGVVLMQKSEGGALGMGGGGAGGGGFLTGRGTANFLTRTTAGLALAFFVTSILLTILARSGAPESTLIRDAAQSEADASKKAGDKDGKSVGGVLDALETGRARAPLPAVPNSQ